jgi:hypothetical protein
MIDYLSGHREAGDTLEKNRLSPKELALLKRDPQNFSWVLQEAVIPYGQKSGVKKASKAVN